LIEDENIDTRKFSIQATHGNPATHGIRSGVSRTGFHISHGRTEINVEHLVV